MNEKPPPYVHHLAELQLLQKTQQELTDPTDFHQDALVALFKVLMYFGNEDNPSITINNLNELLGSQFDYTILKRQECNGAFNAYLLNQALQQSKYKTLDGSDDGIRILLKDMIQKKGSFREPDEIMSQYENNKRFFNDEIVSEHKRNEDSSKKEIVAPVSNKDIFLIRLTLAIKITQMEIKELEKADPKLKAQREAINQQITSGEIPIALDLYEVIGTKVTKAYEMEELKEQKVQELDTQKKPVNTYLQSTSSASIDIPGGISADSDYRDL